MKNLVTLFVLALAAVVLSGCVTGGYPMQTVTTRVVPVYQQAAPIVVEQPVYQTAPMYAPAPVSISYTKVSGRGGRVTSFQIGNGGGYDYGYSQTSCSPVPCGNDVYGHVYGGAPRQMFVGPGPLAAPSGYGHGGRW